MAEPGIPDPQTALRPLRAVDDAVASLRSGALDGTGTRRATLRVGDAVEATLRRLLRDSPRVPVDVRLRALAPDELRTGEVLAELRQHDRISMELAASVHELFEGRRRLEQGSSVAAEDAPLALRVAERLEAEVMAAPLPAPEPPRGPAPEPAEEGEWIAGTPEEADATVPPAAAPAPRWPWVAGGATLLVLALLGIAFALPGDRGRADLNEGIALFRSGAHADAASRFWRAAEAAPDDPTPRLYLARIHRRLGRYDLAAQEIQAAVRLAPEDADAQTELGFLLLDTGRAPVAVERFRAAIRLDSDATAAWVGLVGALRASGRDDAADRVVARAPPTVRDALSRPPQGGAPRP